MAQPSAPPPQYPEIGWLGRSSYCSPYFGFRLTLPTEFKFELIHLPVQSHERHLLLATHLQRLDRYSELFVSALLDRSENSAHLAAKARIQEARADGLMTSGPNLISVNKHELYRIRVEGDSSGVGNETSYYFVLRGYVVHVSVLAHQPELATAIGSAIERIEFLQPEDATCPVPSATTAAPDAVRLYYGPALPTDLVDSTIRQSPADTVPAGSFSGGVFSDHALGVRAVLPPDWQPIPIDESYRITELMRDPTLDRESSDRRRALFRACTRVLFAASDPTKELASQIYPGLVIAAMPLGCIPDLVPPPSTTERAASEDFATLLIRSTGAILLGHGAIHKGSEGALALRMDGALPYQVLGERLFRRLSLRLSATASGPWMILVYSVAETPAAQRELESRVSIRNPSPAH